MDVKMINMERKNLSIYSVVSSQEKNTSRGTGKEGIGEGGKEKEASLLELERRG